MEMKDLYTAKSSYLPLLHTAAYPQPPPSVSIVSFTSLPLSTSVQPSPQPPLLLPPQPQLLPPPRGRAFPQ